MAKSSVSVESLIKSTYALQVAVRCTDDVELICRKNQLKVCEMLKPFCALSNNCEYAMLFINAYFLQCPNVVLNCVSVGQNSYERVRGHH